jgi:hypothetical protein
LTEESRENDFWNDFDNTFNRDLGANPKMVEAAGYVKGFSYRYKIGSLNSDRLRQILETNTQEVYNLKKNIKDIVPEYIKFFIQYIGKDFGSIKFEYGSKSFDLFSDFGQGRLYDPRRENEVRMHVMDGYGQYHVWHRFNWMAYLLHSAFDKGSLPIPFSIINWLYLDRLVGAAAEIHSISQPDQSCDVDGSPPPEPKNGHVLSTEKINLIGSKWQNLEFDQIETRLSKLIPYESHNRCEKKPLPDIPDIS